MPNDSAEWSWTVTGSDAVLRPASGGPFVRLDLLRPEAGILPCGEQGDSDHLLGLDLRGAARLVDHWVRGADLTAVFEPADARRLRATAMWRSIGTAIGAAAGQRAWEVVVSVQTSLLQSDAALAVTCVARGASIAWGTLEDDATTGAPGVRGDVIWSAAVDERRPPRARAVLVRRRAATSLVVAVHSRDGRGLGGSIEDGRAVIECPLFGDTIEKGVLLRSRVLAAIGPSADDTQWAARLVGAYRTLPPMLDT